MPRFVKGCWGQTVKTHRCAELEEELFKSLCQDVKRLEGIGAKHVKVDQAVSNRPTQPKTNADQQKKTVGHMPVLCDVGRFVPCGRKCLWLASIDSQTYANISGFSRFSAVDDARLSRITFGVKTNLLLLL